MAPLLPITTNHHLRPETTINRVYWKPLKASPDKPERTGINLNRTTIHPPLLTRQHRTTLSNTLICLPLHLPLHHNNGHRTTGLDAELFYVRNGVVNSYAMIFVVPVPADIYDLEFTWQSLTEYPVRLRLRPFPPATN